MKVLQLVTSSRPFFEQQVSVLEERGLDCTVLDVPGEYRGNSGRTPIDYVRFYPKVLSELRSAEYDLVHANYGLVAPFALAQPIRPVVVTLWGTDLMSEQEWLRSVSRYAARRADAAIVPSPTMSRRLEADHELVPFGVDTDLFRPVSRERARQRLGWETERRIALFPYDPSRSVKDFPRANRLVESVDADLELRTIDGVDYEEMPYYLNASDVLLVTSSRESGPMVVKEAAACDLPVVSTNVGFVRETLEGVANCVVSDDDRELVLGLEAVLDDGGRSDGRERVDELGLEAMGRRLVSLYRRSLETCDRTERRRGVARGV
ncbi:glycosyltransferase family 4 protein [Natrarchaeobius oligotrophus]|uniref:Glycosyltransferase n=1 Tax=Natrarchaeobius chitinivorans TaxID=1679083 RepID=A0A3N6M6Y7_NATCH|nr:glycosyltransferase family 4 protein [Natrarchaeobius chitinivorans]RQG99368.1 glycosyltransferase [Natrarchaeobius chitinivorans]